MNFRALFLPPLLLVAMLANARLDVVRVGILRDARPQRVMCTAVGGALTVLVDGKAQGEISSKDALKLQVQDGSFTVRSLGWSATAQHTVVIRARAGGAVHLRVLDSEIAERDYPGDIEVRREGSTLLLVNALALEEYVAGVVQSEAGRDKDIEYYKLQAVSCRTYALANQRKHMAEGFELCDATHCQVYKGRNLQDTIRQAVEATRNMVAVDSRIQLIHATFHSNCGGETMNAEDLWSKSEPYLIGTMDTFCLNAPHAAWRKSMARAKWLAYLKATYQVDTSDTAVALAACTFDPPCRFQFLPDVHARVPLQQVRADMKFNSAYFRIWPNGDNVIFDGRGFGHGVGLCQEGAMRMAREGYSFIDMLHHYFAEVHLVDLNTIDFFRDEGN